MFLEYGAQRPEPSAGAPGNRRAIDEEWVTFFTRRLGRLLEIRGRVTEQTTAWVVRLLDLAILSTYRDLQALGREEAAKTLLRGEGSDTGDSATSGSGPNSTGSQPS